jgi:hypothetical protein
VTDTLAVAKLRGNKLYSTDAEDDEVTAVSEIETLYDTDFVAWSEQQAEALRRLARRNPELAKELSLDFGHLIEEIEAMGRSEAQAVETRLELLLMHLAKWRCQPEKRSKSWQRTIREQRRRIPRLLKKNPALRPRLPGMLAEAWEIAREDAAEETGLPIETFPEACPFMVGQALDPDWWPEERTP